MTDKREKIDPIPREFMNYEAAGEFWDTHDTTDYLDDLEEVTLESVKLQHRYCEVELDYDLIPLLDQQAELKGVNLNKFVNDLLRSSLTNIV